MRITFIIVAFWVGVICLLLGNWGGVGISLAWLITLTLWSRADLEQRASVEKLKTDVRELTGIVARGRIGPDVAKALGRLSLTMGNPAVHWDHDTSIEAALIDEANRRLAGAPMVRRGEELVDSALVDAVVSDRSEVKS